MKSSKPLPRRSSGTKQHRSWQQLVQNLLPVRVALKSLESDSARLDQVTEQFGNLANHFSYSAAMTAALEKHWAKMDQKLFLLAYALHPARQLKHINSQLPFAYTSNIAEYATELYQRLFGSTEEEDSHIFQQMAEYLGKQGQFAGSVPRYTDPQADPQSFWLLMAQSAPQLSKLAILLCLCQHPDQTQEQHCPCKGAEDGTDQGHTASKA